jgi:vacuolar-type H+-ATPase subunit H
MKRFFKILTVVVVFVLALLLILPLFFKAEIVEMVKKELNKQVTAKIDFVDADLSLIRQFPDFTLDLNELSVVGTNEFLGDTLLKLNALSFRIDLFKAFNGNFEIKELRLFRPYINLYVNDAGLANWDIVAVDSTASATAESNDGEALNIKLKLLSISEGTVQYLDESLAFYTRLEGISMSMKGDLSADKSTLAAKLNVSSLNLAYEGFPYLKDVKTRFNAMFLIDMANSIYTFKDNELLLNDLLVNFEGSVGMNPESYTLLLNFNAPKTDFKQLVSLIPALYANEFDKLDAKGSFNLNGFVKGTYSDAQMPAYGLNLAINNASFGYPDLPSSVKKMNLKASVNNNTGETDDVEVRLTDFNWELAGQPFRMDLSLKTPVSDPQFDVSSSGVLDFGQLAALLPEDQRAEIKGELQADFKLKGKMSDIENNRFNQVNASGSLVLQNFEFLDTSLIRLPISITNAQLNLSPQFIDLFNTDLKLGKTDLQLDGRIKNYLAYFLADGELIGQLDHRSQLLDVDELLTLLSDEDEATSTPTDTTSTTIIELPAKLVFDFNSEIQKLVYHPYELTAIKSKIHFENQTIVFNEFSANTLDGQIKMNGAFTAITDNLPQVSLNFALSEIDIPKAWETIELLRKAAPVAQQAQGNLSAQFELNTLLDSEMNPVYESMQGGGGLQTSQLSLSNLNSLQKLNALLGTKQFNRMVTDGLNISFEFVNGRVYQKPFEIRLGGQQAVVSGSTGFDQTLDYDLLFKVPYGILGSSIQKGISDLAGNALSLANNDEMQIKAKMTGTVSDPDISIDYKDYAANLKQQITDQVNQKIEEEKEKLRDQAREEAAKIISEAQSRADRLVAEAAILAQKTRDEADGAAKKIRDEAEVQANNLIVEGKKNGKIAEIAAKEAAKKLRAEADKQAESVRQQANQRAAQFEQEAQQQADSIMQRAKQQADKL